MALNEQEEFELLSLEREKSQGGSVASKAATPSAPAGPEYIAPHNILMGGLKAAGDIGSTIMRASELHPLNLLKNAMPGESGGGRDADRRATMGRFFKENANPESMAFKGGELAVDVAGTAGAPGVLAGAAKAAGATPSVVAALQ